MGTLWKKGKEFLNGVDSKYGITYPISFDDTSDYSTYGRIKTMIYLSVREILGRAAHQDWPATEPEEFANPCLRRWCFPLAELMAVETILALESIGVGGIQVHCLETAWI